MHRERVVALYDVHSWAGLLFSVLIFIVCASGAVAVFSAELDRWSNPALRVDTSQPFVVDADEALAVLAPLAPSKPTLVMALPTQATGLYGMATPREGERLQNTYLDATNGRITAPRQTYTYWYLRHLHVRLMNHWYGRVFIGFIGMAMLLSITTGVLLHQHPIKGLFRMRWSPGKGLRTLMADAHKWLGVWAMLFHIVIAFSGAWLGVQYALLTPAVAFAKFDGDAKAARQALLPPKPTPSADEAEMIRLAPLVARAPGDLPGLVPTDLELRNWGRANAVAVIRGDIPNSLAPNGESSVTYDGVTGRMLEVDDVRDAGVWEQIAAALKPLHYGYFGGTWLKFLYLLLGLTPAVLSASGALIWFERRARMRRTKAPARRDWARSAVLALTGGSWLALLAGLVVPTVIGLTGRPLSSDGMTPLFFGLWAAATAGLVSLEDRALGRMVMAGGVVLGLAGCGLALAPPLDGRSIGVGLVALVIAGLHALVFNALRSRPAASLQSVPASTRAT